jgi:hypothetical protein
MKLSFLERSELKYLIYSGIFAFVYFIFLLPKIIVIMDYKNPWAQFILFNLGIMILLNFYFKSAATNSKPKIKNMLGMLLLILAISCWSPPYGLLPNGTLAVQTESSTQLVMAGTDFFIGNLLIELGVHSGITFPNFIPYIGGDFISWVFIITYTLVPMLLLFLSSRLLKDFVRNV